MDLSATIAGVIGFVAAVVGLQRLAATAPDPKFHVKVPLAGSDRRLERTYGYCPVDLPAARTTLRWDYLFIAGYVLLLTALDVHFLPPAAGQGLLFAATLALPFVTGVVDVVENGLTANMLGRDGNRFAFNSGLAKNGGGTGPFVLAAVSAGKFLLFGASVVGLFLRIFNRGS